MANVAKRTSTPIAFAVFATVAILSIGTLSFVGRMTRNRIEHNERAWLLSRLEALVPPELHDNDLLTDRVTVVAPDTLGTTNPVPIYRARKAGMPTAAVLMPIAADGYGGPIQLMIALSFEGKVMGVQVMSHHETPGLGDAFERSDWLARFSGHYLAHPQPSGWAVRKDGGQFDQFTGATITPRAIVKAVRRTLEFYQNNRDEVFAESAEGKTSTGH